MPYGTGSIYQRGRIWWISYMVRGEQVNESSKSQDRDDAKKLLRKRLGEIEGGRAVSTTSITVPQLLSRLEEHYIEKERRSIADLKGKIAALQTRFKGVRASEFGTSDINRLKSSMKRDKATNATINRYLAALRRAFKLAERNDPPLVGRVPHFEMLPEDNARQGFINHEQYRRILEWLPDHLKGMLIFGYHYGVRKTAIKLLERSQVDWPARLIRAKTPKGGKPQGEALPIYGDVAAWLDMQMSTWGETPKCRWIVHHDGHQIGDFRKAWATACKAAAVPGLLFHDLKRSAVRNMEQAGVPRSVAMKITGHKTESIYKRYAIVSESDVKAAGEKLGRLMESGGTVKESLTVAEGRKN